MLVFEESAIRKSLDYRQIIPLMRDALTAQSRGECQTPAPMHLDISKESAEVHIKAGYRTGGKFFALKVASTFPFNRARGKSTGNGLMLLCSAETGEPAAMLQDAGHLTDVRTSAVTAMVAAELNRRDTVLGIIGSGIQARLQAAMHALVLPLEEVALWGRTAAHVEECRRDIQLIVPGIDVRPCNEPAEVARRARMIVCCSASRSPLLRLRDLQPGTLVSAVGSDAPGKQELDPAILRAASLLLADSRSQCTRLGELQHAPEMAGSAVEIGAFCLKPDGCPQERIAVCDFTGLGIEDLFIAEYCMARITTPSPAG